MIRRLLRRRPPPAGRSNPRPTDPPSVIDLVLFAGQAPASLLRDFAVWCAKSVWDVVEDRSYDHDPTAHARFVSAVETAERFARDSASEDELRAAYQASVDPRSARTGWWPGRLANVGAFRSAALMAARFACRATCAETATQAARHACRWSAWAVGYLAVADGPVARDLLACLGDQGPRGEEWWQGWRRAYETSQRVAEEAMVAAEAEHAAELRRRLGA